MKINAGCGKRILPGFVNVDIQAMAGAKPDILADLRAIPLDDGCADELHSYHVIEHFYVWHVPDVLAEWRRLLRTGGALVLELPNLEAAARNLLAGTRDQMCMWPIYGDPATRDEFMIHRWGYTPNTICALLAEHGFEGAVMKPPQTHCARVNRDMRVEARKS